MHASVHSLHQLGQALVGTSTVVKPFIKSTMAPKGGQGQQDDVRPKKRQRGRRSGRRIQAAKAAAQRLLEEHQEEDHEESDRTESPPKKYRREDTEEAPARSSPAVELVAREVKHPSWLKSTPTKISEPAAPTKAALNITEGSIHSRR